MEEKVKYVCPECGQETNDNCIVFGCLRAYCTICEDYFLVENGITKEDDIVIGFVIPKFT